MGDLLDRLRSFFASTEELDQAVEESEAAEDQEYSTYKANRAFDRHGPSERDLLPGSPRARLFGRRR